jgi:hypothetical protein
MEIHCGLNYGYLTESLYYVCPLLKSTSFKRKFHDVVHLYSFPPTLLDHFKGASSSDDVWCIWGNITIYHMQI